jgi:hypothetical protein
MKIAAGIIILLVVFIAGLYIGGSDKSMPEPIYQEVTLAAEELIPIDKKNSIEKNEEALKELKINSKKELVYYMDKVPFPFLASYYRKKRKELEKIAFSGELDKGKHHSEKRQSIEQGIFDEILPTVKTKQTYFADGSISYKGFTIPFEGIFAFIGMHFIEDKQIEVPDEARGLWTTLKIEFDLTQFNGQEKEFSFDIYGGNKLSEYYIQDGNIFVTLTVLEDNSPVSLQDIKAFLIGVPNSEGSPVSIRLFSTESKRWVEVSSELHWRVINHESFQKKAEEMRE